MASHDWWDRARVIQVAPPIRELAVSTEEWSQAVQDLAAAGVKLLSLWGASGRTETMSEIRAAFMAERGVLVLMLDMDSRPGETMYPAIDPMFPAAARMQRALRDLYGVRASAPDQRPWLRHAAWPADVAPLQAADDSIPDIRDSVDAYEFVRVEGEGVHEIPVGPVHAGIIEPGHFRFSVVGEKVLRLEERLGYVHKGIERRFRQLHALEGHRLAARVSGDSAVAFSWAYCQALESVASCAIPPRAAWLRGLCLELERVANHLGDLGALGNDAGFAFGLSQFMRLKERLLRATEQALGQRYLMDAVVPGGTARDLSSEGAALLAQTVASIADEAAELRRIYEDHEGLRDRFVEAGKLEPTLAARLGVIGLAGRASGQSQDARRDYPCAPYDVLQPKVIVFSEGDVAARVNVRFEELQESCRLIREMIGRLPGGPHAAHVELPEGGGFGAGVVEGWRGPAFVGLGIGPGGTIQHCHPHDPSWQNWPALEHAIIGNIVPDFPLINKSFNLSYSGHDL
ncbi:MAG TPA: NADH-quinone oxidoreductase subunit C [Steroidobacteraceae bacterium]